MVWHVALAALMVRPWEDLWGGRWRRVFVWDFVALNLGFNGPDEHVMPDCVVRVRLGEV